MKATPTATVDEAIQLLQQGLSTRQTAERLNISAATASRILATHKDSMPPDHKVNKGGRPRKIPPEAVDNLRNNVELGLVTSLDQAKCEFDKAAQGGNVSMATVKRRLKEAGVRVDK
ncbi:hypothetical protein BGZ79_004103 [Entomortierella chlamydospora]|nr:hypothetical protein BGZ79_004103 [Entomortierella chlamydospora]